MWRRPLASAAFAAACVLLGACAQGLLQREDGPGYVQAGRIDPQRALATIAPGRTTKDDVTRALGPGIVIHFDSGNEVWVYRWKGAKPTTRAATEVVILFGPDGVAKKARLRPGEAG